MKSIFGNGTTLIEALNERRATPIIRKGQFAGMEILQFNEELMSDEYVKIRIETLQLTAAYLAPHPSGTMNRGYVPFVFLSSEKAYFDESEEEWC